MIDPITLTIFGGGAVVVLASLALPSWLQASAAAKLWVAAGVLVGGGVIVFAIFLQQLHAAFDGKGIAPEAIKVGCIGGMVLVVTFVGAIACGRNQDDED